MFHQLLECEVAVEVNAVGSCAMEARIYFLEDLEVDLSHADRGANQFDSRCRQSARRLLCVRLA